MDASVLSTEGKEVRKLTLSDAVFNREVSEGSIYTAIRNELANLRVGTAKTKGRSEVRGTRKKPWRQKGTGRARAGSRQSPLWVGGGIVFGPQPRDYSYKLPRKVKRAALKSILSQKAQNGDLMVVEDFTVESGKTKDFVAVMTALGAAEQKCVLVLKEDDPMLKRAARNVPWVRYLAYNRLRAHDLYYARRVVIMESAAKSLGETWE
jgi:large subunit ribosomal protein L4